MSLAQKCCDNAMFAEQIGALYLSNDFSDVTFIVESEKLPAHKCILAACSPYFRALLFGGFSESTSTEIELNVQLSAFKIVLQYIYTVRIPQMQQMERQIILDSLSLAHEYGIEGMQAMIIKHMTDTSSFENIIAILNVPYTEVYTMPVIDKIATELLASNEFKMLPQRLVCSLLERDSFYALEIDIFQAAVAWCKHNEKTKDDIQTVMSLVRFHLMEMNDLLTIVRKSSVIDYEPLLDLIHEKINRKNPRNRGILTSEVNIATTTTAEVVEGLNCSELLNGNVTNYNGNSGYTWHYFSSSGGILVELGNFYVINHIKVLLWDRDDRSYSYYIEISQNKIDWERVVDYTQSYCRSWQNLYFTQRVVRYIKLVGTRNSANRHLHAVALEAYHKLKLPFLVDGIVSPTWNVASVKEGTQVSNGLATEGDSVNVMLNDDFKNYTASKGFTYHEISPDNSIIVHLRQPYNINSLRLLLWDLDGERTYSFYIETSINETDWQMAVDMRNERLKSWQKFTFETRPVVYIKIVGTYSSKTNCLHLVHFEAPFIENPLPLKRKSSVEMENPSKKKSLDS